MLVQPGVLMAVGRGAAELAAPIGQQLFTGSGAFIVPTGVTSICAVAIGSGGDTALANWGEWFGGGGGGLAYSNDLPVTPGESLTVQVNRSISRLRRETTSLVEASGASFDEETSRAVPGRGLVGQVRWVGGASSYALGAMFATGGGAAGYTSDGLGGGDVGISGRAGGGMSPYGGGPGADAGVAVGASSTYGGGAGENASPGLGCVRVFWGDGRAFPDTKTEDL